MRSLCTAVLISCARVRPLLHVACPWKPNTSRSIGHRLCEVPALVSSPVVGIVYAEAVRVQRAYKTSRRDNVTHYLCKGLNRNLFSTFTNTAKLISVYVFCKIIFKLLELKSDINCPKPDQWDEGRD